MTQLGDSLAGHMTHWSTVDWFTVADALGWSNGIFSGNERTEPSTSGGNLATPMAVGGSLGQPGAASRM